MYPCPSRGYMPFVPSSQGSEQKRHKKGTMKKYQVTLRDRKGCTYTYIVKAEDANSIPLLCEAKVVGLSKSNKCLVVTNPKNGGARKGHADLRLPIQLPAKDAEGGADDKKGLLHSVLKFFRDKTGIKSKKSSKNGKSKRKVTQIPQRKRQRTVSLKSNLDPIEESPEEEEEEEEEDVEGCEGLDDLAEDDSSYTHDDSNSDSGSESGSDSGSNSEVSSVTGVDGEELLYNTDDDDTDDECDDSGDDGDAEGSDRAETTPEP